MNRINPDGEVFTPKVSALVLDAEQITVRRDSHPLWAQIPCGRDAVALGEHTYLKVALTFDGDGNTASAVVTDCVHGAGAHAQ